MTSSESLTEEKARLRSSMRRDLAGLTPAQAERAGEAIDSHLRLSEVWRTASEVAVFASLPGEVDTRRLIRSALADDKVLLLPRTLAGARLEFARVESVEELVSGRFDLLEPGRACPVVSIVSSTLMLLPGLAFDRRGGRLGRGAGYYDRALAELRGVGRQPTCLGIGLALQIVSEVPMTSLDERMDGFVTEAELWWVC